VVIFAFRPTLLFLFCVAIRNNLGKPPDCGMYGNPDLGHLFSISFAAPNPARAQGAAWNLAAEFVDGTPFSIVESANLPVRPESRQRLQIASIGLVSGVLAGA
jgi:hypothetical protein